MSDDKPGLEAFASGSGWVHGKGEADYPRPITHVNLAPFREADRKRHEASLPRANPVGKPSEHPLGVTIRGQWSNAYDGHAEHVRRTALALAATGCPVMLRSGAPVAGSPSPREFEEQKRCYSLIHASIARPTCEIWMLPPRPGVAAASLTHRFVTEEQAKAINFARCIYTGGWPGEIPEEDAKALNQVGQVWVAHQLDYEKAKRAGVERVHIVPCPAEAPLAHHKRPGSFYAIGDWVKQSMPMLVAAFLTAFRPGEAKLYLRSAPDRALWAILAPLLAGEKVAANDWTAETFNRDAIVYPAPVSARSLAEMHANLETYVALAENDRVDVAGVDAIASGARIVCAKGSSLRTLVRAQSWTNAARGRIEREGSVVLENGYGWNDLAAALREPGPAALPAFAHGSSGPLMVGLLRELVAAAGGKVLYEGMAV